MLIYQSKLRFSLVHPPRTSLFLEVPLSNRIRTFASVTDRQPGIDFDLLTARSIFRRNPNCKMKDKVVIITGGSSGIGLALAYEFLRNGSKVVITARTQANLNDAAKALGHSGSNLLPVVADAGVKEDCEQTVKSTIDHFGKIDVLVNNAGISMRALFAELDLSVLEKVMQVNFWGTVYMSKYALPHLLRTKGSIAGISSIAGYRGLPARTGYSASKFAMNGFLESLRGELLPHGVNVIAISPGFTASNIRNQALTKDGVPQGGSPLDEGKIMTAEEVARRSYRAIAIRRRGIIMSTQGRLTVFLNKWLPGFMDKMVIKHFQREEGSPTGS